MSDETREQLMDVNRDQSRRIAVLKNELNLMKGFRDGFYVKCTGYEKLLNDALAEVERLKEENERLERLEDKHQSYATDALTETETAISHIRCIKNSVTAISMVARCDKALDDLGVAL